MKQIEPRLKEFWKSVELTGDEIDMNSFVNMFQEDMKSGLSGNVTSMPMYASYIKGDQQRLETGIPVAVIDAGGTNLRVALVRLREDYSLDIEDFKKYSMPGVDREVGSDEFFKTIAPICSACSKKEQPDRILFLLSHAYGIGHRRNSQSLDQRSKSS